MFKQFKKVPGFTLIEILVVVALIAILAAVTIIAINPARNFAATRNSSRSAHLASILDAVTQYTSEAGNTLTLMNSGTVLPLCSASPVAIGSGVGNANLATTLVPTYIAAMPIDPSVGTAANTGYSICITFAVSGRVQLSAPNAENGAVITVQR